MENEKTMENPQEPLQEGAGNSIPTARRRHRRPSHRNTAAASAETAVQPETAATAPAKSVQPEPAAGGTPAPEISAGAAVAVEPAAVTPAASVASAAPAASVAAEPQSVRKSAAPQKNGSETTGAKPAAPQKPASETTGAKPAAAQKPAAQQKNGPAQQNNASVQRQAAERRKDTAPQRPTGTPNERREAASQKSAGQHDRKAAAPRNAAANDRKTNTNTARRAVEPPKRSAAQQKRSAAADRSSTGGGWTWRGYLCRLSVVILGTALTLLGAGLIGRWQEVRRERGAMQAVYEELTANRAAVGMACRGLLRDGRGLQPRAGEADSRVPAVSPTANPMTLRASAAPGLRDEAWQVLCTSGAMVSVRDGELLRDVAGCYADMDRFARQLEGGNASGADAAQTGRSAAGRIDRVLRQLESKYGFGQ